MYRLTIPSYTIRQPPPPPPAAAVISDSNMMLSGGRITETHIESLPDELLFDILVRLPADFLHGRARLVCCRWWRIIQSDAFITTHIQHHSTYGLVLSLPYSEPLAIFVTATQGRIQTSELRKRRIIATSCNGLDLEWNAGSLHVTNPATKQSFPLPSHDGSVIHNFLTSIAYSAASMEYKITLPYKDYHDHPTCLDILTVGVDKSWRHVEIPPLPEHLRYFLCYPRSSEGFLHWKYDRYCLTLNVETETIKLTEAPIPPPPHSYDDYSYFYLSTGRYITLLASHRKKLSWEVWEMRPAESVEWRKAVLPDIDLEPQKSKLEQKFGYDGNYYLKPVGWVKYPEVLALSFWRPVCTYIFYNLETHEINECSIELACDLCCHDDYKALVHRNSLVWLTQD